MDQKPFKDLGKKDVWVEGVRTIVAYHKRSLLDFLDMYINNSNNNSEKNILSSVKRRVHNDLSQCCFSMGVLLQTFRSGGDITPFKENMIENKPKIPFKHRDAQNGQHKKQHNIDSVRGSQTDKPVDTNN